MWSDWSIPEYRVSIGRALGLRPSHVRHFRKVKNYHISAENIQETQTPWSFFKHKNFSKNPDYPNDCFFFNDGPYFRLSDDHYAKSHALDSPPAYFLVLVRLVLLGVFMFGAVKTFEGEPSAARRSFIGRLLVLGTLWFASMPILVLIAMICAEYLQEPVSEKWDTME